MKKMVYGILIFLLALALSFVVVSVNAEETSDVLGNQETQETTQETQETEKVEETQEEEESTKEEVQEGEGILSEEDKDYIKNEVEYYVKLIFEFIASLTGSGTALMLFWKILKTVQKGIELKMNKDNLSKEELDKMIKENNDILIQQIEDFKEALKEFENIKEQNLVLCDMVKDQNKLIAKLVVINPTLASNGEATEILKLMEDKDIKDGVDNDSENEINNI